jgi:hypothetical protein
MERYIGMDVHAGSCTLAVISEKGRKLKDLPVDTNGQALVEAVRMIPGHKHLVMEEGLQGAWLYETLSPMSTNSWWLVSRRAEARRATSATPTDWRRSFAWATSTSTSSRRPVSSPSFESSLELI